MFEGISRGWRDFYPGDLPFQWIDVSDVVPGRYRLGGEVDPDNFVAESNEANNGPAIGPLDRHRAGIRRLTGDSGWNAP